MGTTLPCKAWRWTGGPSLPVTNKQTNWLSLEEKQESVHAGAGLTCGCVFARFLSLLFSFFFFFCFVHTQMCVSVFVGHSRLQARLHLAAIKPHASRSALRSTAAGSCFKAAQRRTGRQHFHYCAPLCHVAHNKLNSSDNNDNIKNRKEGACRTVCE